MASIPGFRFDVTGASGSLGVLGPKSGYRCYVFPRGGYAAQDSVGTKITFDSASVASRFTVNSWIQSGLLTSNIRQVGAVGGNSLTVSGAALTVTKNDRIYLIGNTEPTVSGGSATYTTPNTIVRQRDDDAADLYTNSMITTNTDGLVQGFAVTSLYDLLIQDGNRANQGSLIDLPVGVPEGISVTDWAFFGASVTVHGAIGVTGLATFGSTVTMRAALGVTGPAVFATTVTVIGGFSGTVIAARLGQNSTPTSGGAIRFVEGNIFPLTVAGVNAALTECASAGGGTVYVPSQAGISITSTSVKIPNRCVLIGTGTCVAGTPTFIGSSATNTTAMVENLTQDGTQQMFGLANVQLDGGGKNTAAVYSKAALYCKQILSSSYIRDVRVVNVHGKGILLEGTTQNAQGPFMNQNVVAANCSDDCVVINEGSRSITFDFLESDNPGTTAACIRLVSTTSSSAQSIGSRLANVYCETNGITSQSYIVVDSVANVQIDNFTSSVPSGTPPALPIIVRGLGNFAGGASGFTLRNGYIYQDGPDGVLISDQTCGVTVTTGANSAQPNRFVDWYSAPVAVGTNGIQSQGQVVGLQYAKVGPDLTSGTSVTLLEGSFFNVTGTSVVRFIQGSSFHHGRVATFMFSNASPGGFGTGGNIRLAGGTTWSPAQWDAITLACSGLTWFEATPR